MPTEKEQWSLQHLRCRVRRRGGEVTWGARPSLHGGAGEAGRKGNRGCVAQQLTLEGKWWPGMGLNPVTGLSKRCPPSLEEQGAEERVQP